MIVYAVEAFDGPEALYSTYEKAAAAVADPDEYPREYGYSIRAIEVQ